MSDTDEVPDIDAGDILFQRFIAETDRRERGDSKVTKQPGDISANANASLDRNQNHAYRGDNTAAATTNNNNNNNNTNRREPRELRRTLSNLLLRIENELRNPVLETERPRPEQRPATETNTTTGNAFVPRPSFFSQVVRNLLLLDYFIMIILFPFSLYNIVRICFNFITLSRDDFTVDILTYLQNTQVISDDATSLLGYKDGETSLGLLSKFHNVLVFYSAPVIKRVLNWTNRNEVAIYLCNWSIRLLTVLLYLTYGLGGTVYMGLAGFFFALSLGLTVYRRYRGVHQILAGNFAFGTEGRGRREGQHVG